MPNRGSVDWLGNIIYSDTDLADMRQESEAKHDRRMEQRITEQEERIIHLEEVVRGIAKDFYALQQLVGASPVESALVTSYPRLSVAQTTGHADDRR